MMAKRSRLWWRLAGGLLFGALLAGLLLVGYAAYVEPRQLWLARATVTVPGLPAELDGFTIGVLSDLHLGPLTPAGTVRQAFRRLALLRPKLTVIAGDLVSADDQLDELQALLPKDQGPLYAVPGNWDYGSQAASRLRAGLGRLTVLVNGGALVAPRLWLGGLDDGVAGRPSVDAALAGAPRGAVRLLLAHEPDLAVLVKPQHRVTLQISGHSHGGQVRLPGRGPLFLPPLGRLYPDGLAAAPATYVYTTRGVGQSQLPLRLFCPPQVALLTLRSAEPARPPSR